ncbi:MAG: hypothetical protein KJO43_06250 [Phycisphaerae bacterium]|nr:hypothetical protein [Phycisphaerae bacterium]
MLAALDPPPTSATDRGGPAGLPHPPVVAHASVTPTAAQIDRVTSLAAELLRDHPQLALERAYEACRVRTITPGPALHLDDLSEIGIVGQRPDARFLQERARLRAGDGDFVAASFVSEPAYARYCRDRLALGDPTWLLPAAATDDARLAAACWWDRPVRAALLAAARVGALRWIHPHYGGRAVWDLAMLLHRRGGVALGVIAPPPGLTEWVNDKVSFAETVTRLLGPGATPRIEETTSVAWLSRRIRDLAERTEWVVIKVPDSAGAYGTVVLDTRRYRGRDLGAIRADVLPIVTEALGGADLPRLLIRGWETAVVASPSAQLWIPPPADGPPVVEGVFLQTLAGHAAKFEGARPGRLPASVESAFVEDSWLLGLLFQQLGYVGRCSFDAIVTVVGGHPRLVFVECNGRWGGTSGPMSLLNRLFGDWARRPFAVRTCWAPGLTDCRFRDVLAHLGDELFDARTGRGSLILLGPGRTRLTGKLNVIALAETPEDADRYLREDVTPRLRRFAAHD